MSELLQAQLLQPINVTPIQPRLAESNLFLIGQGGPGALSFNEFNPLFSRDRLALQLSGLGAEHSTYGVEPVVAGMYRNLSFSAGWTRFKTDGFRVNNDQKDDIVNVFAQAELTSQTSVQAEYRHRETVTGDLFPLFFPDEIRQNQRQDSTSNSIRLGARHAFGPGSILLASFMYQKIDLANVDRDPPIIVSQTLTQDDHAIGGELQHLFRWRSLDLVNGVGYFDVSAAHLFVLNLVFPPSPDDPGGPLTQSLPIDPSLRHFNLYSYAHIHLPLRLTLTLGCSADFKESALQGNAAQANPKVGVIWSPFAGTTVRAALLRAFKRELIADQTLEPTQVAGFNQLFDDINGTRSWRYGVALDQRVSRDLLGGVEGTIRDLPTVPFVVPQPSGPPLRTDGDWKEYQARAYWLWTPFDWLASRAEYSFERLVRSANVTAGVRNTRTHRVQVGVNAFHRTGLGASATATYYNQIGTFGEGLFRAGSDRFWLFDASLGWRLPERYGLVSVAATNLTDHHFNLFENGFANSNPTVAPARAIIGRVTLALP